MPLLYSFFFKENRTVNLTDANCHEISIGISQIRDSSSPRMPRFFVWGRGLTDTNLATILHIDLFLIFLRLPKTLQFRKDELKPATIQRLPISAIFENIMIILFVVPPKFSSFSWDLQSPQENWKTMLMDNFGGATKSIMVFLSMAYSSTFNGRISYHVRNGETS